VRKSKDKAKRYKNLVAKIGNWKLYLWKKLVGFEKYFDFEIKDFGVVRVPRNMLGPFRENFLDDIYIGNIPSKVFQNKERPTIIDIGANVGYFSLSIFARFPKASVYSFEPHPYCFKVLSDYKETFANYNFNIFEQAVSNADDKITLFITDHEEFTTTSSIFDNNNKATKKISVDAIKLEYFILQQKLEEIDLLKLDCEGSEYAILYNLPKEFFSKITAFSIETHSGNAANENLNSLRKFIGDQGYKVEYLDEGYTGYIWAWRE
jgi:FkbM family methyltransferase